MTCGSGIGALTEPQAHLAPRVAGPHAGRGAAALRRRGLPRIGASATSPLRGILQLLPLALATRWKPFDAVRMLEFLQTPHSPVPREVRHALARLLPECPGRGGPEWEAVDRPR